MVTVVTIVRFGCRGAPHVVARAHTLTLGFAHPRSVERIEATAPLDAEFERALALFGWSLSSGMDSAAVI